MLFHKIVHHAHDLPVFVRNLVAGICLCAFLFACTEIDNYDPPNGSIYGALTDELTNEAFQTEQPNGFTIKLFEKGGELNSPIVFSGKPDGTFENAWIFQNEYKVVPTEGAFFPVDTATILVGERTEQNFEVEPFLAIVNIDISTNSGNIISKYQIDRSKVKDKIIESKTLVSKYPTINNVVFEFMSRNDLADISDEEILGSTFTDEISNLKSGENYFVRIAARTNNRLNKYNYSKIFSVTIP